MKTVAHRTTASGKGRESISTQIWNNARRVRVRRCSFGSTANLQKDDGVDFISLQPLTASKYHSGHAIEEYLPPQRFEKQLQDGIEDRCRSDAADGYSSDPAIPDDGTPRLSTVGGGLRSRRAALLQKVEQNPKDWRLWLALQELQDESARSLNISSDMRQTNAERRSNAEVNLFIYEKALRSVIDPEGRERLHLGMMSEALAIWESSRISSKWPSILREHPSSHRIWKKYLDFYQSKVRSFSLDETRKHYLQCLQDVHRAVGHNQHLHSKSYAVQLYILLRLTILLREAGYAELATAIWQALLEFEFCKPPNFRCTTEQFKDSVHENSLLAFEQFWNSEVPRIGEVNAEGWLNFDERAEEVSSPPIVEAPHQEGGVALRLWADVERKASSCSNTPSRSIDGASDDPYRVVLFSDIKPALIVSPTFPDHHALLAAFFSFCHLPPHTNNLTYLTDHWQKDQYLRNEMLYEGVTLKTFGLHRAGNVAPDEGHRDISKPAHSMPCPSLSTPFATPLAKHLISPDTLFSSPGEWFSSFGQDAQGHVPIAKDFILATLKTLVKQRIGGEDLAEYLLGFELWVSPATVSKSAQNLLKKE